MLEGDQVRLPGYSSIVVRLNSTPGVEHRRKNVQNYSIAGVAGSELIFSGVTFGHRRS